MSSPSFLHAKRTFRVVIICVITVLLTGAGFLHFQFDKPHPFNAISSILTSGLIIGLLLILIITYFQRREKKLLELLLNEQCSKTEILSNDLERIDQLSRFYKALSESNKAVLHSENKDELIEKICCIAVHQGGLKMAWFAKVNEAIGAIEKGVRFGKGIEYLDGLEISLSSTDPLGQGPTGIAIREGRPVWVQDFNNDSITSPWHERAIDYGWKSSGSLPLRMDGKIIGALTFYSEKIHAFDQEIRKLLIELMNNTNFALDHLSQLEKSNHAKEELQKLFTAVEQSDDIIIMTDPEGLIEYVNPAFEKITGYASNEVLGLNPRLLKSGDQSSDFYHQLWSTLLAGRTWRGEFHNKRKNGELYWVSAVISPVFSEQGKIIHFVVVQDDVTDRKTMEQSLRDALERAEASSRAKSAFLAVMSHELRTPLNGILGFADLLSDTTVDEEQSDYIKTIYESGNHLLGIVNDVLDFSSIEKGAIRIEHDSISIRENLESCCQSISKFASDKGLDFRCVIAPSVPENIVGDAQRIRQILLNLLNNAVKFTAHGTVLLDVSQVITTDKPHLKFSIQDTGCGISSETIPLLFNPFFQADSSLKRPFEGTGLGLAISRRLAEAMRGTITVESKLGEGSLFIFLLPMKSEHHLV